MKRGGHVAGRRGSHCLCDSVQIHPTLKRRMCTKRKRGESCGCTKLSSTARNPPAAGHTPRHERMKYRGRISTRVLFFHEKNLTAPFPSTTAVKAQCALRFSAARKSVCRCDPEEAPARQPRQENHPFSVYPPPNETVPPTKPARC